MQEKLLGQVDRGIPFNRFQLRADEFFPGANVAFNGDLYYPATVKQDGRVVAKIANWGCGIFSIFNSLSFLNRHVSLEKITGIAMSFGASETNGTSGAAIRRCLGHFGVSAELSRVNSSVELLPHLSKGCLVIASVIEACWDETYDSNQRGDEHYVVIVGCDRRGNLLVCDSSLRDSHNTYNIYALTPEGFERIGYSFDGDLNYQETQVRSGANWDFGDVLVLEPV